MKRLNTVLFFLIFIFTACQTGKQNTRNVEVVKVESVDLYPKFPGCDDFYEKDNQLSCLSNKFNAYVKYLIEKDSIDFNNFNDTLWINFKIDTSGTTHFIKTSSKVEPQYIEKLKKIARHVPKMKPAVFQDKPVDFEFKIPIVFPKKTVN
jgi:hypothetical protein